MKTRCGSRFHFQSVHTVPGEVDTQGRPLVHGHNYAVTIVVEGKNLAPAELRSEFSKQVLPHLDKRNLDQWVQPATGERICEGIFDGLKNTKVGPFLSEIQLEETAKNTFNLKIQKRG